MSIDSAPLSDTRRDGQDRALAALTWGTGGLVAYAIVFPRAAAALFLVPILVLAVLTIIRSDRRELPVAINALSAAAAAFAVFALASSAWSAAPMATLGKTLFSIGAVAGLALMGAIVRETPVANLQAVAFGIVGGVIAAGAFVCFETLTEQAVTRALLNWFPALREGGEKQLIIDGATVIKVADNNINRRATVLTLLLGPSLFMAGMIGSILWRRVALGLLLAQGLVILVASTHQSSQAAILCGLIAFGLASVAPRLAAVSVGASWALAALLMVPAVLALHATELHKSNALFHSARHRIVIWNATAENVKKSPLIGIGADATPTATEAEMAPQRAAGTVKMDGIFEVSAARHAHNAFLQVWYELGAIGALLFALLGVGAVRVGAALPSPARAFAIAQVATAAGMIAFSFSLWQLWMQGAAGLSVAALPATTALAAKGGPGKTN